MKFQRKSALRAIFFLAGFFAFFGGILGFFVGKIFLIFPIFVGGMQIFFATTGLCPALFFAKKLGFKAPEKI